MAGRGEQGRPGGPDAAGAAHTSRSNATLPAFERRFASVASEAHASERVGTSERSPKLGQPSAGDDIPACAASGEADVAVGCGSGRMDEL